jgi:hypothetical protein
MAMDPEMTVATEAELAKFHKGLERLDKGISFVGVIGSALNGATLGALLGLTVHWKDKSHREIGKHALYGAAIAGGVSAIGYMLGKSLSFAGHFVESEARREMRGLRGQPRAQARLLPTDPSAIQTTGYSTGWDDRERERMERERIDRDRDRFDRFHHDRRFFAGQASPQPPPTPLPPIVPQPTGPTVDCPAGMQWDPTQGYCMPIMQVPLPPPMHHAGYFDPMQQHFGDHGGGGHYGMPQQHFAPQHFAPQPQQHFGQGHPGFDPFHHGGF